jgi:hypothetical protein
LMYPIESSAELPKFFLRKCVLGDSRPKHQKARVPSTGILVPFSVV